MANLSVVLKGVIRRVARKEIREDFASTRKAVLQYRRDIAKLKRDLREQARQIARLRSAENKRADQPAAASEQSAEGLRFSARSVIAQRKRLKLTRRQFAKLAGVTPLTVFNWEHGKSRPRQAQFAALVALRSVGRREACQKLEALEGGAAKKSRRLARRKPR